MHNTFLDLNLNMVHNIFLDLDLVHNTSPDLDLVHNISADVVHDQRKRWKQEMFTMFEERPWLKG